MSKASDAGNAVVNACEQICDLYGVQHTREQSRVIMVEGTAGRFRPMYFGKWVDDFGKVHASGRADLLARPRITLASIALHKNCALALHSSMDSGIMGWVSEVRVSVPLWIECKSGKGRLTPDQVAFKSWVESNGDHYVLIHDDARPLIAWFEAHGVKKEPKSVLKQAEPLDDSSLRELPCRHCKQPQSGHIGKILACKTIIGKVWSPQLRVAK